MFLRYYQENNVSDQLINTVKGMAFYYFINEIVSLSYTDYKFDYKAITWHNKPYYLKNFHIANE